MGIYVGGTGTSNHFEDYEEGLWQPQVLDGNGSNYTINYTTDNCRYTKIGRMVFCYYVITRTESGSKTGNLRFYATTLPFALDKNFHGGSYWVDHGGPTTGQGDAAVQRAHSVVAIVVHHKHIANVQHLSLIHI